MKIKIALLGFFLIFQSQEQLNEKYNFLNDCIDVFSIMNKAQIQFDSSILNNQNPKKIKKIAENYNRKLGKCIERLSEFSNASDHKIKKSLELILTQINSLIEHNEKYLGLKKSDDISNEIELLNMGQKLLLKLFDNTLLIACSITVQKPKEKKTSTLTSYLTLSERNSLNEKLISDFGDLIISNKPGKHLSSFEKSAQMTYQFLNEKLGFTINYK